MAIMMCSSGDSGGPEIKILSSAKDWVKPRCNISFLKAVAQTLDAYLRP
jgi:hypothetical protein